MTMDAAISAQLIVAGIKFKLNKDDGGHAYPSAEITFVTDDLPAATELAWHLGQLVDARLEPQQPRLPDGRGNGVSSKHKPMCAKVMFGETCDCGLDGIVDAARGLLAPSADGTTVTVTRRGRRH
jgi:hypothetical protein